VGRNDTAGYFYYVMELADALEGPRAEGQSPSKSEVAAAKETSRQPPLGKAAIWDTRNLASYTPRTLAAELKLRGRLPLEECIQIGLSLTEALGHLHRQGLVHRDVKPSNIIFVDGVPKLADVGLVTTVGQALSFVGTEGFIPPEGPGTHQADLYSLGIVLYVLSTGKSHQDFPEPPADLPSQADHNRWLEFDAVVQKACQPSVRERFQSAEQMHEELALLADGESVRQRRSTQHRRAVGIRLGLISVAVASLLLGWPRLRGLRTGYTPDPETALLYEQGRWHYSQLTPEHHVKALGFLTQAVQRDPKFIQPYAEMAALYTWAMLPEVTNDHVRLLRTREIADRALVVGPDQAEGHIALSWCHFLERDWRGAEAEIVRAIQLNSKVAIAHDIYSFYLTMLERFPEAHREAQRAEEVETSASKRASAIIDTWVFIGERRFDLAVARLKQVLELDENFAWGHLYLASCYQEQTNYLASLDEFEKYDVLASQDAAKFGPAYGAVRQAYNTQGEQGYWRKVIELTLAQRSLPEAQRLVSELFNESWLGGYYAKLGEKQKALDELEKHFDEVNIWHQIKFEPIFDNLHGEPRYQMLVKRAGLRP